MVLEYFFGEKGCDEVAGDKFALFVNKEAAVCVTVPRDADGAGVLKHLANHKLAILLEQRIWLVIGKGAVGREEILVRDDRQLLEDRAEHGSCHTAAAVEHNAEWSQSGNVDETQHLLGITG